MSTFRVITYRQGNGKTYDGKGDRNGHRRFTAPTAAEARELANAWAKDEVELRGADWAHVEEVKA